MFRVFLLFLLAVPANADRFLPRKEDLNFVNLRYPAKLTSWMRAEQDRLTKLCQAKDMDCFRKHYRQGRWALGNLHSSPGKLSPKVGTIDGTVRLDEATGEVFLYVEFVPTGGAAGTAWLPRVNDFSTGPRVFLRELRGEWALLPSYPFPENAWLNLAGSGMNGLPESSLGELIKFTTSVPATNIDSKKEGKLESGIFVIEKIKEGKVTLRPESPGDLPCGRIVAEESPKPMRRYVVERSALLESTGIPKFELAYPKGCDSLPKKQP